MLIRNPDDVSPKTMDMPGAERVQMRLMVGREDGAPNFAMRIFDVEPGGQTPHHLSQTAAEPALVGHMRADPLDRRIAGLTVQLQGLVGHEAGCVDAVDKDVRCDLRTRQNVGG